MEGIFVIIILGIISSIFGKLSDKEQKSMPPFGGGKPVKTLPKERNKQKDYSLEDFTKEIFQQFTNEPEQKSKPSTININQNIVTEQKDEPIYTELNTLSPSLHSDEKEKPKSHDKSKQVEMPNFVPDTKDALIQAIVTSEILGPPLSKRR